MSITEKYKGKIIKKVSNTGVPKEEYNALTTQIALLEAQVNNLTSELAGKVTPAGDAVAGNVLSGKTFINSTGQVVTGTMANRGGAQTVTPGTSNKTLNAGYYSGNITIAGDADLIASNIKKGVNIFGVTGSVVEGRRWASGTTASGQAPAATGLPFTPSIVIAGVGIVNSMPSYYIYYLGYTFFVRYNVVTSYSNKLTITSNGFSLTVGANADSPWVAFE